MEMLVSTRANKRKKLIISRHVRQELEGFGGIKDRQIREGMDFEV
jgi:hypothetical protein